MPAAFEQTSRAIERDGPVAAWLAWGLGTLALGAWGAWFALGSVTVYEVSPRARLEVQLAAHAVGAPMSGVIRHSAVRIGESVRAGDLLVELDAGAERLALGEEQAKLAGLAPRIVSVEREIALREQALLRDQQTAQAAAKSARFRIDEAEASAAFARDQERRLTEESRHGSVAQSEALRARAEATRLGASRDALGADLSRLEGDAQTRVSQGRAQIETLRRTIVDLEGQQATGRATIERLTAAIDRRAIRAPVDGRIGEGSVLRPGAHVAEGQVLASIVPRGDLVIVAEFEPQAVLGRVRAGQAARLRLDGFPWAQYGSVQARVTAVAGEIRDRSVRVELVPDGPTDAALPLQHGLPGTVEIAIETAAPMSLLLRAAGQRLAGARASPAGTDAPRAALDAAAR